MNDENSTVLRGIKTAHIIGAISSMFNVSIQETTDIFYKSQTAILIEDGVADLQCRSDKYLATLVWEEYQGIS